MIDDPGDDWVEHRRAVLAFRASTTFDGQQPFENRPGRTHGKASTYRAGCRCEQCRAAKNEQSRRRRQARRGDGDAA